MHCTNESLIGQIIEKRLTPSTDYIYGFANLSGLLVKEFSDFQYGISIGRHLDDIILEQIENGPTKEYFNHYKEVNVQLNELAEDICSDLRKEKINCIAIVPTLSLSGEEFKPYLKFLRYKVSHKMIATRAGLGWIGKTDLFISKEFGPRIRLVSILADSPVSSKVKPNDKSRCGKCNICVQKCPAKASNGILWDIHKDRDLFFDAHKCYAKCGEFGRILFKENIRICGICVSVCPLGKKAH